MRPTLGTDKSLVWSDDPADDSAPMSAASPHAKDDRSGGAVNSTGDANRRALRGAAPGAGTILRAGCVIAAIVLGQAVIAGKSPREGQTHFPAGALVLVVLAIAVLLTGWLWRGRTGHRSVPDRWLRPLLAVGLAMAFWRLPIISLFIEIPGSRALLWPFVALATIALILTAFVLGAKSSKVLSVAFILVVAFHGLMGAWYLGISGEPRVDVYLLQRLSCEALLSGKDPYAITFPDIYGPGSGYYRKGLVINGRVQFGYDYPPLSLLLAVPGYLMGDLRYSHLLAMSLAALLLGFARPGRAGKLAALMMLFTPDVFHQLENAWTEPFVLLTLCAAVYCASRRWMVAAAAMVGLFLVSKQYALLAAPAAWLLIEPSVARRRAAQYAIIAIAAGAAVTLPFILWNTHAFFHSMTAPFLGVLRMDSISFLPLIAKLNSSRPTILWPLMASALGWMLVIWRRHRGATGFAAGAAMILLLVFIFSTQSFGNYYFFAAGALCAGVAAGDEQRSLSRAAIST